MSFQDYSLSDQHIVSPMNPKYEDWFCQNYKDLKIKPPQFCLMESLHNTACVKKFEFLRPFWDN